MRLITRFLHADDIRTLATSEESLKYQAELVKEFADQKLLKLNISKCEIVVFSAQHSTPFLCVNSMDQLCQQVTLGSV